MSLGGIKKEKLVGFTVRAIILAVEARGQLVGAAALGLERVVEAPDVGGDIAGGHAGRTHEGRQEDAVVHFGWGRGTIREISGWARELVGGKGTD